MATAAQAQDRLSKSVPRRTGRFTQTEITRAVQGVRRAGCEPRGVSIYPDGRIQVQLTDDGPTTQGSWDDVLE